MSDVKLHAKASDISLHIAIQVHIDPAASAEQIDDIFAAMARHLSDMQHSVETPEPKLLDGSQDD